MRALPGIQKEHKTCHTVIVGGDEVSYGRAPQGGKTWREMMLEEVGEGLDPSRTHFLGKVPYATYKRVLQISAAHVYLTYPFVLSWSMLEAMAIGCAVIGSDTAPVREVVEDGVDGRLAGMFGGELLVTRTVEALHLGAQARLAMSSAARRRTEALSTSTGVRALDALCWTKGDSRKQRA